MDPAQKALQSRGGYPDVKRITIAKQADESMKFANEFAIVYLGESRYADKDKIMVISNCWRD
jgi:hypothetical protein